MTDTDLREALAAALRKATWAVIGQTLDAQTQATTLADAIIAAEPRLTLASPDTGRDAGLDEDADHYWTDAPDDDAGWLCAICGERRYPGDPTAHGARLTESPATPDAER